MKTDGDWSYAASAKEHEEPAEAGSGQEGLSLGAFREGTALPVSSFETFWPPETGRQ